MEFSTTRVIAGLRMLRSEHDLVYLLLNYNDSQGSKRYDIIFNDGADFFNSMNYEKIEVSIREKLLLNQKMIGTEQEDL